MPRLGTFIAELAVPEGTAVAIARTGKKPGHHTLWADPIEVMHWVRAVVDV